MMPLTVACVFVQGEYPFTVEYVSRLKAMVTRWIDRPFKMVCLTDQPWAMPQGVESIIVQRLPGCFAYWTKLELFNPLRKWTGRVLYLDLDTLIVAPLGPIVDAPAEFAVTADPPVLGKKQRTVDAFGRTIVRKFNSSLMVWDGEKTPTDLYTKWTLAVSQRLSGDQDWLAERLPNAHALPLSWFPRLSEVNGPPFGEAKVILSKVPKNHIAAEKYPWFEPLWGAA